MLGACLALAGCELQIEGESDNHSVARVDFYDGSTFIGTDTTAPYSVTWKTMLVSQGAHTLTARAYDAAGNLATSAGVTVQVL